MIFKNFSAAAIGITGHQSEIIELALTYGFAGIEVNISELAARVRLKGMPYARRLIDSAKIRVGAFALPFDVDVDDAEFQKQLVKLAEYAQVASELDCTRTYTMLAPAGDKRPYHENFEFHRHRLGQIAAVLAQTGVRLAVGFRAAEYFRKNQAFQFIHDFEALSLLINMVASPSVGVLVDTWDLAASGGNAEMLRKLHPSQIIAVQVAEVPAEGDPAEFNDMSRLLPGDEKGRGQSEPILRTLMEMGFAGPVTPKPSRGIFPSRKRDIMAKQTADALERVWRAAGLPVEPRRIVPVVRD